MKMVADGATQKIKTKKSHKTHEHAKPGACRAGILMLYSNRLPPYFFEYSSSGGGGGMKIRAHARASKH